MRPLPGGTFTLADGRRLSYDDVGAREGRPVVYLHGCPDSRLTRHPDDEIAARVGVRLIAVDRPGYGGSDGPRDWTRRSVAGDIIALTEHLGVDRFAILGWSSGGQIALECAAMAPSRVAAVGLVASTVPAPYEGDSGAIAQEMLLYVAPDGLTHELALEHVREGKSDTYLTDLDSISGLHDRLAVGMELALATGSRGAEFDLRNLMTPWDIDLAGVTPPVTLWYGTLDDVVDQSVGAGLAAVLPHARLEIVEGATHLLLLTHWSTLLDSLARQLDMEETSCR